MIYVRSDIHFVKVKHLKGIAPEERAAFRTDAIILKVKLGRSWIAVVGVYRPPSIPKHQWTRDCLLYTSPSPRDLSTSRMPSSA